MNRIRVPLGVVAAVAFLAFARPTTPLLLGAVPLVAGGLGLRAWAAGTLRKMSALATAGPYAHTRNPLYLGSLLMALGFGVAGGRWPSAILLVALFAAVYGRTILDEERFLRGKFSDYAAYADAVPRLLPRLLPARLGGDPAGFAWAQYARNREYEALIGVAVAYGLLAVRALGV